MRKIIIITIVLILIISLIFSCSNTMSNDSEGIPELKYDTVDLLNNNEKGASLYFLSKDSTRLVAEYRNIQFSDIQSNEFILINELINGPVQSDLKSFDSDFKLERIEIMSNLANVYLLNDSAVSEFDKFSLALAITNTLTDFSTVEYVNIFFNGKPLVYENYPVGTLIKNQNVIQDEINRHLANISNHSFLVTLYFPDKTGKYILPEIRQITFDNNDFVFSIIHELVKGPKIYYDYQPFLPSDLKCLYSEYDENFIINLGFNMLPSKSLKIRDLSYAAIVYSLSGFDPACSNIRFCINDYSSQKVFSKNDFRKYAGSIMDIYTPLDDLTGIHISYITVPQNESNIPSYILKEVLNSINIVNIPYDCINNIYTAKDTIVIDWNKNIKKYISGLLSDTERLFVFSIVDSLTNLKDIKKVQFLIDGKRAKIFSGTLDIYDPILRNPGIILNK